MLVFCQLGVVFVVNYKIQLTTSDTSISKSLSAQGAIMDGLITIFTGGSKQHAMKNGVLLEV